MLEVIVKGIYKQKDKFIVTDLKFLGYRPLGPDKYVEGCFTDNTSIYFGISLAKEDDYIEFSAYTTRNNIKCDIAVKYVRDITPMEHLLGAVEIDGKFYELHSD